MKRNVLIFPLFLWLIGLLCLPSHVWSQGLTTAAINGIVIERGGAGLPLANVIALHKPTGTIYGISTRDDGRFNLQGLKAGGPYIITAKLVGYKPQTKADVYLDLGQNLAIDFTLVPETVELGEVAVVGEQTSIISAGRTGASTNVSKAAIERLPTISRSFTDFEKLSPLFFNGGANGRNNRYNNIQIDGANYNDLFGLGSSGTPGGQANTTPISLDALQEFQVVIAPYDVRQSGFTGGGVNAITRSGTNEITGSVFLGARNQNQVGLGPVDPRMKVADFSNAVGSFRIGGPIIQDKLFFFANGELTRRRAPSDVTLGGAGITGTNVSPIPASVGDSLKSVLMNTYGYNPGSYNPATAVRPSNKLFLRLDYNISDNHHLTIRNNYVDASDDILQRTIASFYFDNTNYTFNSTTNQTVAQLNSTFGNQWANELILGYTTVRDVRQTPGANFPFVRINYLGNVGEVLAAGTENFSQANALDQNIFEVTDNVSYYAGGNVFTIGTHNEFYKFSNLFIRNLYGYYEFPSVAALIAGTPSNYQLSYSLTGDLRQRAVFSAQQYGVYAQVENKSIQNLTVTAGMRMDVPTFPDMPNDNLLIDSLFGPTYGVGTNKVPSGNILWSPRLGVNWDVNGDKSTQVRGGIGLFTGRLPYVWISNQYGNDGVDFARLSVNNPGKIFSPDPYNQPKPGSAPGLSPVPTTEVDLTTPGFKMPQVFRIDAAVDRQLPLDLVGTLELVYSQTVNDVTYADINQNPLDPVDSLAWDGAPLMGHRPTKAGSTTWTVNKTSAAFTNVLLMKNTSDGYSWNITAQIQRPLTKGLFGSIAYTYGHAMDHNSVVSSQAYSQWRFNPVPGNPNDPPLAISNFDRPHRVIATLSYEKEFWENAPTTISLVYSGYSGEPYSYTYSGDVIGDGETGNHLVYVPKDAADIILTSHNYAALDSYIESDPYLRDNRGRIAPRNGGREPWTSHVDLRLSQDIPIVAGHTFEVGIDVLNIMNLLSRYNGLERYVPNQNYSLLKFQGFDPGTMKPTFSFAPPATGVPWQYDDLNSRWQAQLSIRYSF
ncbi:MAG TPA: carboxypeptidase regulatory-like domain-containing protein [Bacteroidota bacterium]|nr:carboxypeptidase regulatory-like domain-containing protein [Bacteroidota bacterium]